MVENDNIGAGTVKIEYYNRQKNKISPESDFLFLSLGYFFLVETFIFREYRYTIFSGPQSFKNKNLLMDKSIYSLSIFFCKKLEHLADI